MLSGDEAMQAAYLSGDPYLEFAKQAGAGTGDVARAKVVQSGGGHQPSSNDTVAMAGGKPPETKPISGSVHTGDQGAGKPAPKAANAAAPIAGAKQADANKDSVWVQLKDGTNKEFKPSEVRGNDLGRGAEVTTPDGRGKVVAHGEPPYGGDVKQPNVQPGGAPAATPTLITPKQLNDFVPQARGVAGEKRRTRTKRTEDRQRNPGCAHGRQ